MHEDGRVEDMDPVQMGLDPSWAPPGFEGSVQAPPPSAVGQGLFKPWLDHALDEATVRSADEKARQRPYSDDPRYADEVKRDNAKQAHRERGYGDPEAEQMEDFHRRAAREKRASEMPGERAAILERIRAERAARSAEIDAANAARDEAAWSKAKIKVGNITDAALHPLGALTDVPLFDGPGVRSAMGQQFRGSSEIAGPISSTFTTDLSAPQPSHLVNDSAPPVGSQSSSSSNSWRGATIGPDGSTGASGRLNKRADAEAQRVMGMYEPAIDQQRQAISQGVEAQAAQSNVQAQGFRDEAQLMRDQQEGRQRELAEIADRSGKWTTEIKTAMDSIPTVDSKRMFKNASTGQEIGMAAAAFMGGFLQPVLGTNTPMDIINKAIDRDVQDQMAAQDAAQRKVWNLKDLAARDENAALFQLNQADIGRVAALTAVQRDVQAQVQGYQSDIFKAQGSKLLADLDKSIVDTYNNIFVNTRGFLEQQRHNMVQESIQSQARRDALAAAQAKAAADAADKKRATFLHGDTGVRATGPNARDGGWVGPDKETRDKAAARFESANVSWQGIENIKKLTNPSHFGKPGSEERARAKAAVVRQTLALMSQISGLGQKEDTARMESIFGGDPDQFFRVTDAETIGKVLQDAQDALARDTKSYAKNLQYDPQDKIEWSPPKAVPEQEAAGPSAGDGFLRAQAGARAGRPEELQGGLNDMVAELKTYPGLTQTPEGRAQVEQWLGELNGLPENKRTVRVDGGFVDVKDVLTSALVKGDKASAAVDANYEKQKADSAAAEEQAKKVAEMRNSPWGVGF